MERCNGCSVVNPMPASTCWHWRAAVRSGSTGDGLGHRRRHRCVVFPCGREHGVGHLDGDERLRQAMADGLEHRDLPSELDPFERVGAGQVEHPARRPDQLV